MSEGVTDLVLTHLRAVRSEPAHGVALANVERTLRMGRLGCFEAVIESNLSEMAEQFEAASPPPRLD